MLQLKKCTIHIAKMILVTWGPVFCVLLPFVLKIKTLWWLDMRGGGLEKIYGSWDGPNYILNAIGLYDPLITGQHLFVHQPLEYYAAHFPLFSLMIRGVHMILPFIHYPMAGLITTLCISFIYNCCFFHIMKHKTKHPYWLTFAFTVFPPRQLILRTIIAPETLVNLCIMTTIVLWDKRKYIYAGFMGFGAIATKFQAVVLVPAVVFYTLYAHLVRTIHISTRTILAIILMASAFFVVSTWYLVSIGNFWAYFKAQDIVGMYASLPFAMFNHRSPWVQTGYLEDVVLYFIFATILCIRLLQNKQYLAGIFCLLYTLMLTIVPQRDIARIAYPLVPFCFFTFHTFFTTRTMRNVLIITLPIVIIYSINFILHNQAPVADWGLLR